MFELLDGQACIVIAEMAVVCIRNNRLVMVAIILGMISSLIACHWLAEA